MESVRTDRTRTWKKKGESLKKHCTAKGKKEGVGGRMVRFMVAIAHNKGGIKCRQYFGPINSETCKSFIDEQFSDVFKNSANPKGKLLLQAGDPSQNSRIVCEAMNSVGCRLFKIPRRSPDLNPIENMFYLIRNPIENMFHLIRNPIENMFHLKKDAVTRNLEHETYEKFSRRAKKTGLDFPIDIINRTIESMSKQIDQVTKTKGQRTKY